MLDRNAVVRIADFLRPEDFYLDQHAQVFRAALNLYDRSDPIDLLTLAAELERMRVLERVGGQSFLAELQSSVPTAANAEYYGRLIEEAATKRKLITAGGRITALGFDEGTPAGEALDTAESVIFNIAEGRITQDFVPLKDILKDTWDQIEAIHKDQSTLIGVPCGFADLDAKTGGFQKSDLIIVAARPGVGKTSFCLGIAQYAAIQHKIPVAVFSLEMSEQQLVTRMLCSEASVDSYRLRTGLLKDAEWPRIAQAMGALSEAQIYIDDSPNVSVMEMRTKARRLKSANNLGLVIVDYLQLMQGRNAENRVQEVSDISRGLKSLARELQIPVIACSQLSREPEKRIDHRPQLADLRESGCLSFETPIYLPDLGIYKAIGDLVGQAGFRVLALNTDTWELERRPVSNAFSTGRKPVFKVTTQLGRRVRATANHKFLTINGWRRLDQLRPGEKVALPRRLDGPSTQTMSDDELDARVSSHPQPDQGGVQYHVEVSGKADVNRFLDSVGAVGDSKLAHAQAITEFMKSGVANTNRDVVPRDVWRVLAEPARQATGMTSREMQKELGHAYCGTTLDKQDLSRERAARVATTVGSEVLWRIASSDVYWDSVASIIPDGEDDVYDLTVDGLHNFVAGNIVVHNSLEQDSDLVLFIYRERFYNDNVSEDKRNVAEIIIAKHRNGPTGKVELLFIDEQTKFANLDRRRGV